MSFTERGWVILADGVATLTDAGRTTHDDAQSRVAALRASVTEGVSDEEYLALMATLEKMARNVGWTESAASDEADAGDASQDATEDDEPEGDTPAPNEPKADGPDV